jgi:hypothetical protein
MFGFIVAAIGVGLAAFGILLLLKNRQSGYRGLQRELFAITLLVGGAAVLLTAFTLALLDKQSELAFSPDAWLEAYPTAAGDRPAATEPARLPQRRILVLAWGTPSDMGSASPDETAAYTRQLGKLAAGLLRDFAPQASISAHSLTREEFGVLSKSSISQTDWCERFDAELLLAVGLGTTRTENGDYALWREPVYEALDCKSAKGERITGRIKERAGDRFPYELAASDDLRKLLAKLSASN